MSHAPKFEILYEDADIVVVDKPAGLLTVPIPKSHTPSLFEILKQRRLARGERVFVVHRIDRYTTGIVLFAKNAASFEHLKGQFMQRTAQRIYLAAVEGLLKEPFGTLVHHMKQVQDGFRNVVVPARDPKATPATLHYRVAETYAKASLVEIKLESGLKNQIRVQFAAIGHPVIGDRQYGSEKTQNLLQRQALHAHRLGIVHPRKHEELWFTCPLPHDMEELRGRLGR